MSKLSDFDLDFSHGLTGENLVSDLLTGGLTVEVKTDRRWKETNNIYVETECWYNRSQSWEQSGLSVSKAAYWAYVLESGTIIVPIEVIKQACKKYGRPISCRIEPNNSKGYLITIENLLDCLKGFQKIEKTPG